MRVVLDGCKFVFVFVECCCFCREDLGFEGGGGEKGGESGVHI